MILLWWKEFHWSEKNSNDYYKKRRNNYTKNLKVYNNIDRNTDSDNKHDAMSENCAS